MKLQKIDCQHKSKTIWQYQCTFLNPAICKFYETCKLKQIREAVYAKATVVGNDKTVPHDNLAHRPHLRNQ